MVEPQALAQVQALLGDAPRESALLIEYLHRISDHYGKLGSAHLAALARELNLSQVEVYEVASFYHHFEVVNDDAAQASAAVSAISPGAAPAIVHATSPGAQAAGVTLRVCNGLSCSMAGAGELLATLQARYAMPIRVIAAPCIGRCEQAPAVCAGQHAFGPATPEKVAQVIAARNFAAPALVASLPANAYATLAQCLNGNITAADAMERLSQAGLRGLGGAGFPTGRKWKIVAAQPEPRLMAVNIDEGEPGTFKDRWYLETQVHAFLEGMLIAAWAVGVQAVYIYLRDEYHALRAMLQAELDALPLRLAQAFQAAPPGASVQGGAGGSMDEAPPGFGACNWRLPELHLRRGAGAYICGEESAMIESIEGKRGLPRLRPPYVAEVGLFGRPTLVQNLETLCWVPKLVTAGDDGGAAFAAHGRNGRKGLRSFSVSGRVRLPGVHVAPAGISLRELVEEFCGGMVPGHELYAYLPGGASGGILPASLAHLPLDFDTLQEYGCFIGSAAIVVLSKQDTARMAAQNTLDFFKHESCGQCTPCRVGTEKAVQLLAAEKWDVPLLQELGQVMMDASICGLGQAAPNPFLSVIKFFPHEVA